MDEIWIDVEGFEGLYQVSNLGRVKSLDRTEWSVRNNSPRKRSGRMLKPSKNNRGYEYVDFYKDGKPERMTVHRIVAIAFLSNPGKRETVNHIDGIKANNRAVNLEWMTLSENINHAYKTGLKDKGVNRGEANWNAILDEKSVIEIRDNAIKNGGSLSIEELGRMFGVGKGTIKDVVNRKTWKHVS